MPKYKRSEIRALQIPEKHFLTLQPFLEEAERRGDIEEDTKEAEEVERAKNQKWLSDLYDSGELDRLIAKHCQ